MRFISLLLFACVLCGCSAKFLEKQQYSLADIHQTENYGKKYCVIKIVSRNKTLSEAESKYIAKEAMSVLKRDAPNWFSDDENSVPIIISHYSKGYKDTFPFPVVLQTAFLSLPTLFTIPSHLKEIYLHEISIIGKGNSSLKQLDYEWRWDVVTVNPVSGIFYGDKWKNEQPKSHYLSTNYIDIRRICGPIVYAVQSLTPTERRLIEQNDEAWYLDAKYGNKRNKKILIKEDDNSEGSITLLGASAKKYSSSSVKAQAWDYNTMKGYVVVSLSDFPDVETAQQWIHNIYLPEYCALLGIATTGERLSDSDNPIIMILDINVDEDNTFRVDFELVN